MSNQDQHLEIYKLSVEMADRLSSRRALANTFFISLESALSAGLGFLIGEGESLSARKLMTLSMVASLISALWWIQVTSYRNLSKAKFKVIHDLERELSAAPYTNEWELINSKHKWHIDLTQVERFIPIVFLISNLLLIFTAAN